MIDSALDIVADNANIGLRVFYQSQIIAVLAPFETAIDDSRRSRRFEAAINLSALIRGD